MKMTNHTPGPWSYTSRGDIIGKSATLAFVGSSSVAISGAEDTANARLIAAAPDLLAALEELTEFGKEEKWIEWALGEGFEFTDRCIAAYKTARAAIAKAKGERLTIDCSSLGGLDK